jgi:glycosyltransferase involved in cell wall biosynthesis
MISHVEIHWREKLGGCERTVNGTGNSRPLRLASKISVLMSVFNGEPFLREAVESILHQSFADFEFIIVDDASTDNTAKILDSYDDPRIVRLHNPANLGLTRSLNRGLNICRGEFIARQDADDVSLPSRLEVQLTYLEQQPEIGVLGIQMDIINELGDLVGKYEVPCSSAMIAWQLFFGRSLAHPTVMLRRALIETAGAYDPAFPYIEDFELWTRLIAITRIENLNQTLYKYRSRAGSISVTKSSEQMANILAVRRLLASRLLSREIPLDLIQWLHNSQLPDNRLSNFQKAEVIAMILDLKNALEQQGFIRADESGEIHADMLNRISVAARHAPPATGAVGARYAAYFRPFRLVAQAVANPKRAKHEIIQRTGNLLARLTRKEVQAQEPGTRPTSVFAPPVAAGVTVIVLSYQRMASLMALLTSLLQQELGGLPLELIVCNNSPRMQLKQSRFSSLGRLFSQFANLKIFNSSYNWRCRVRYAIGTLATHDTIMFIDDDITLVDRNFISYMYENFHALRPMDLLSCWNSLWVEWTEDYFTCASLNFMTPEITALTQTDTIGPGICMFNKQILLNARIMDLSRGFPNADDMAFPLIAALEWGSKSYFLPSYNMLEIHYEYNRNSLYEVSGHTQALYAQYNSLLKEGYQPVLSRNLTNSSSGETPEQYAVRLLPAVKYCWR